MRIYGLIGALLLIGSALLADAQEKESAPAPPADTAKEESTTPAPESLPAGNDPGGVTLFEAPESGKADSDVGNEAAEEAPRRIRQEAMTSSVVNPVETIQPAEAADKAQTPAAPPEEPAPAPPVLDESKFSSLTAVIDNPALFTERLERFTRLYRHLSDKEVAQADDARRGGDPEKAKALMEKARTHIFMAYHAYEMGMSKYPENVPILNGMGELLYDRFGEETEAVTLWEKAAKIDPKYSKSFNNLGIHYCHIGEYERGIQNLDKALALDPNHPDYLYNMAQMYLTHWPQMMRIRTWSMEKLYTEAMALSKRAAESAPDDAQLARDYAMNFFMADTMGAVPDWKSAAKAWQALRKAVKKDDEIFNAWLNEGRVYLRAKDLPKAEKCFDEAAKIRPQSKLAKDLLDDVRKDRKRRK